MNSTAQSIPQMSRQARNEFLLEQDKALKRFVIDEAKKRPGIITAHAEKFLVDMSGKPANWRLSPGQRRYMIDIARNQLNLIIPEEFE